MYLSSKRSMHLLHYISYRVSYNNLPSTRALVVTIAKFGSTLTRQARMLMSCRRSYWLRFYMVFPQFHQVNVQIVTLGILDRQWKGIWVRAPLKVFLTEVFEDFPQFHQDQGPPSQPGLSLYHLHCLYLEDRLPRDATLKTWQTYIKVASWGQKIKLKLCLGKSSLLFPGPEGVLNEGRHASNMWQKRFNHPRGPESEIFTPDQHCRSREGSKLVPPVILLGFSRVFLSTCGQLLRWYLEALVITFLPFPFPERYHCRGTSSLRFVRSNKCFTAR